MLADSIRGLLALWLVAVALPSAAAEAELPPDLWGDFSQGGMVMGSVAPDTEIRFNGRRLRVSPTGQFTFGYGRDVSSASELEWRHSSGATGRRQLRVDGHSFALQRISGVPQRTVTPAPETLERIHTETALVRRAREQDSAISDFFAGFTWPVIGPITGVYGSRREYNGVPSRPHYGVDIAAPTGTPVRAPAAGIVRLAHPDMYYSSGTLILDHGHGISSSFLHLSKILVREGQRLRRGEVLAEVGSGGRSTGAHLDWRVNWFAERLDAARLAGPMPY